MTITYDFKIRIKPYQITKIEEAFRTCKFIKNMCLRYWIDSKNNPDISVNSFTFKYYVKTLKDSGEYPWLDNLGAQVRQATTESVWFAINMFYKRCKKGGPGKKGFPKFRKVVNSYEYLQDSYKLDTTQRTLTITDNSGVGTLLLMGGRWPDLPTEKVKRVRITKKADGYYVQLITNKVREEQAPLTNNVLGIDVGLESFLTDSNGTKEPNPRFYRKAERKLKKLHKNLSRKKRGSNRRKKAQKKLALAYQKVARKRKDHITKLARTLFLNNDLIGIEKLNVKGMVKNKRMSKSINDAGWTLLKNWLKTYSNIFGKVLVEVNPRFTSQDCSGCGNREKKTLNDRVHNCSKCGLVLDRDHNAAINILTKALESKVGRDFLQA